MDAFNDPLRPTPLTHGAALRRVPKRHYLRSWANHAPRVSMQRPYAAGHGAGAPAHGGPEPAVAIQRLVAGEAVKLRAKALSVLRIAHGRAWVTVTDVGPYSRVTAGDHFLSRGDSLTLLAGQELVLEPFGLGEMTSARFSWGPPDAVAVTQVASTPNWHGDVMQPLLDLRHAAGLAARAMGRLALGLGHAAVAEVERVATYIAMIFIADGAYKLRDGGVFDAEKRDSVTPCKSC